MRRVVVTGLGMVAPTGASVDECWQSALEARSGIKTISIFDPSDLPVRIAGEVTVLDSSTSLDAKEDNRASRFVRLAAVAARELIEDSGMDLQAVDRERVGVSVGVGIGSLQDIETYAYVLRDKGPKRVSPFFLPYTIPNLATGVISNRYGLKGPNICTTTACTSGTHAIGEALTLIQLDMADAMVAGGAESALSPLGIAAFAAMKALSTRNDDPKTSSRPFDLNRDGFVMGEGAGVLLLEELEHARRRGAKIYAEVVGYGMSGDAHHITAPAPEGEGGARCMRMALKRGSVPLDEVDYINAHGTSTKMNDHFESLAIIQVFGDQASKLSVSSTKGVTGHCLGAAGGIEGVYTALAIHNQVVPPTANYETPDPDCPLDYTPNKPKEKTIRYALSNSFGFGGTNATIIMKRYEN